MDNSDVQFSSGLISGGVIFCQLTFSPPKNLRGSRPTQVYD